MCKVRATKSIVVMYRTLIPVLLCVTTAAGAPQDNSNITYVHILPLERSGPPVESDSSEIGSATTENNGSDVETTTETEPTTEVTEAVTEIQTTTAAYKPSRRFYSKLSYFKKPYQSPAKNLIERNGKRKFKSRCRCEKIWNCPKLQITVPRCPDEYFLCCT